MFPHREKKRIVAEVQLTPQEGVMQQGKKKYYPNGNAEWC